MSEPLQAVVDDATRTVTGVYVMDTATVELFRELGFLEQLWPGCTLHDVTTADPRPGPGWTHHPDTAHVWRLPAPDPDAVWDNDTGTWAVPADEPAPTAG